MCKSTISLGEYLDKGKTFVVPSYQRGYVWGKRRPGEKDSVTYLLDDIAARYGTGSDLFLQGVTVAERASEIVLVDGQQRTTCLYLLLKWLGYGGLFRLRYDVREQSGSFLASVDVSDCAENPDEEYQDVYYFKKTLRLISERFGEVDRGKLTEYLLKHVKFLYIVIDERLSRRVFAMMNGSRAPMSVEELIKAELLRLVSLDGVEVNAAMSGDRAAIEWEHNALRSRYAREWDKWLRWWNREDVRRLYRCGGPMGRLIEAYQGGDTLTFEGFREAHFSGGTPLKAKRCFDGLRRLQKRFEDAFEDPVTHNMVGAIMLLGNAKKFVRHYFVEGHREGLRDYYLQVFVGMTHDEIVKRDAEAFGRKYDATLGLLCNVEAYQDAEAKEAVSRYLLRLNIDEDSAQGRRFNFDIWGERSLEHIYAKSKVKHELDGNNNALTGQDVSGMLDRDSIKSGEVVTTEHGLGNLVLLYKSENSAFGKSDFAAKKRMFFSPLRAELFRSRRLLHTVCVFAERMTWDGPAIAENQAAEIARYESDYKHLKEVYDHVN